MRFIWILFLMTNLSLSAFAQSPPPSTSPNTKLSRSERRENKEKRKERRRRGDPNRYSDREGRGGFKKFQLELVKPFATYEVTTTPSGGTQSLTSESSAEIGARFTYLKIREERFGFAASGAYLEYGGGSTSASLRFEGSGTYGFSNLFYTLFGFHLQKFLNAETSEVIDLGFGAQIILGLQLTRSFGFKLAHYYATFIEKELNVLGTTYTIKTNIQAPEIALYWSF